MKERFERRLLSGAINVKCKNDDGTFRMWTAKKEDVVQRIIDIVDEYAADNYRLTLRQLHYQLVGHDPSYVNHQTAYKKLGVILDDCRYAGVIDWNAIEDRGRVPKLPYWAHNIKDALNDTIHDYRLNRQLGQHNHVEVWTEKDALSGIFGRSTSKYHIRLCINKGYTSSSAIYSAYTRFSEILNNERKVTILYFGDHDPSGLDMVRDVYDRLAHMFGNGEQVQVGDWEDNFEVVHMGLTMKQIKAHKLPPNPAKTTDTRSGAYIKKFGHQSWEVDALKPTVLTQILESNIEQQIDMDEYKSMLQKEEADIKKLKAFVNKQK